MLTSIFRDNQYIMQDQPFLDQLTNQFNSDQFVLTHFLINIFITIFLAFVIGIVYSKYGSSLSNRKKLIQSFVLIAVTVMIVISIVKSSLALSLGLVGALSIVRFRTAIKEPEELVYFFIAITLGLGMGANQIVLTVCGVIILILYIILSNLNPSSKTTSQNLIVTLSNSTDKKLDEYQIIDILKKHCTKVNLRRLDQASDHTELSLDVEFKNTDSVIKAKEDIQSIGDIQFSFIKTY